jgi:LysR family transcriptional regulator for bpeEF and oprC
VLDESLVARKLGEFPVITCASPAYLGRFGTPASPQALEGHRAVNFFSAKTGKAMPLDFTIDGRVEETPLPHRVGTNDADTYRALVVEGLGIGQFPSSGVVLDALADGRLVRILEAWDPEPFPLFVMYPRNRHLSARVRAFVDWAMALYAEVFRGGPPSASDVAGR